jgi:hypothetical protein
VCSGASLILAWEYSAHWADVAERFISRHKAIAIFGGPPHVENYKYANQIKSALGNLIGPKPIRIFVGSSQTHYSLGLDDNILELVEADKNGDPAIGIIQDGWMYDEPQAVRRLKPKIPGVGIIHPEDALKIRALAPLFESPLHIFVRRHLADQIRHWVGRKGPVRLSEVFRYRDGRHFYFGGSGTGSRLIASQVILPAFGLDIDDFTPQEDVAGTATGTTSVGIQDAISRMKSGYTDRAHDIDVAFFMYGKGIDDLQDPTILSRYELVDVTRSAAIATGSPVTQPVEIPRGTYRYSEPFPDTKLQTIGARLILAANSKVTDIQAYAIVTALTQSVTCRSSFDLLMAVHKTDPDSSTILPLNDGAREALMRNDFPSAFPSWAWTLIVSASIFFSSLGYSRIRRARVTSIMIEEDLATDEEHLRVPSTMDPVVVARVRRRVALMLSNIRLKKEEFDWANELLDLAPLESKDEDEGRLK